MKITLMTISSDITFNRYVIIISLGEVVEGKKMEESTIRLEHLASGLYLLKLIAGRGMITKKSIKN